MVLMELKHRIFSQEMDVDSGKVKEIESRERRGNRERCTRFFFLSFLNIPIRLRGLRMNPFLYIPLSLSHPFFPVFPFPSSYSPSH